MQNLAHSLRAGGLIKHWGAKRLGETEWRTQHCGLADALGAQKKGGQ